MHFKNIRSKKNTFVVTFTYRSSKNFHHLQPSYLDLLHHVSLVHRMESRHPVNRAIAITHITRDNTGDECILENNISNALVSGKMAGYLTTTRGKLETTKLSFFSPPPLLLLPCRRIRRFSKQSERRRTVFAAALSASVVACVRSLTPTISGCRATRRL